MHSLTFPGTGLKLVASTAAIVAHAEEVRQECSGQCPSRVAEEGAGVGAYPRTKHSLAEFTQFMQADHAGNSVENYAACVNPTFITLAGIAVTLYG